MSNVLRLLPDGFTPAISAVVGCCSVLLMVVFHQLQLMACATLAQRYAAMETPQPVIVTS